MNQALTLNPSNTPELPELMELEHKALKRALQFLDAHGAAYRIIFPSGASFGDLETKPARKRTMHVRRGEYLRHFKPFIENVAPGTGAYVPVGELDPRGLARAVSAWCVSTWGKGNFNTSLDLSGSRVAVFREE